MSFLKHHNKNARVAPLTHDADDKINDLLQNLSLYLLVTLISDEKCENDKYRTANGV